MQVGVQQFRRALQELATRKVLQYKDGHIAQPSILKPPESIIREGALMCDGSSPSVGRRTCVMQAWELGGAQFGGLREAPHRHWDWERCRTCPCLGRWTRRT